MSKCSASLLIRRHDGGLGFDAPGERVAIRVEQCSDVLLPGTNDHLRVEIGGDARGEAAAKHEPSGGAEIGFEGGFDVGYFFVVEPRTGFVEFDGEALAV